MMASLKTTPSLMLPGHPLAKGLVGCWLFNESSGTVVRDSSGHRNIGTLANGPTWTHGPCGAALAFDGTDDRVDCGAGDSIAEIFVGGGTIVAPIHIDSYSASDMSYIVCKYGSSPGWILWVRNDTGHEDTIQFNRFFSTQDGYWEARGDISTGQWYQIAVTYNSSSVSNVPTFYVNGHSVTRDYSQAPQGIRVDDSSQIVSIGGRPDNNTRSFDGAIDYVLLFDRALSAPEITWLHRESFAYLQRPSGWSPGVAAGVTYVLSGSVTAASSLSATAKAARSVSGLLNSTTSLASSSRVNRSISAGINATSSMSGALSISAPGPEPVLEGAKAWRSAVLSNGMTAAAFKLGTVLTGGRFWMRRAGCSAVYRGPSLAEVNFDDILSVADRNAQQVPLPTYLSHEPNTGYCYVVRRFNGCGDTEQTTTATVMVQIDADGRLADPMPNGVFGLNACQIAGCKVQLLWSYCPLDQQIAPEVFNVYWDSGSGQIDFAQPLANLPHSGRQCYSYVTNSLAHGRYRFAVRAGCGDQVESMSLSWVSCSIQTDAPEAMTILAAEVTP